MKFGKARAAPFRDGPQPVALWEDVERPPAATWIEHTDGARSLVFSTRWLLVGIPNFLLGVVFAAAFLGFLGVLLYIPLFGGVGRITPNDVAIAIMIAIPLGLFLFGGAAAMLIFGGRRIWGRVMVRVVDEHLEVHSGFGRWVSQWKRPLSSIKGVEDVRQTSGIGKHRQTRYWVVVRLNDGATLGVSDMFSDDQMRYAIESIRRMIAGRKR